MRITIANGTGDDARPFDTTDVPEHHGPNDEGPTPFPHAIALCPASFERCLNRLLEMLQAFWEEFRRPRESALPSACQGFATTARASLRRGAGVAPGRFDDQPGPPLDDHLALRHANRFIEVLDQAIDARNQSKNDNVQLAIDALKLASTLVKGIPWGLLSERTLSRDYDLLKWTLKKIGSSRKGRNDKNYARLVRQVIRLDPGILLELARGAP